METGEVVLVIVRPGVKVQYIESDLLPKTQTAYIISPDFFNVDFSAQYGAINHFAGIPVWNAQPWEVKKTISSTA